MSEAENPFLLPAQKRDLAWWIATWFGVGKAPVAPGTFGSLAALPIAFLVHSTLGAAALLACALVLFLLGVWASETYMANRHSDHDPSEIVVDEVMGQWLLLVTLPVTLKGYLIGFILFRVFDVLKPWPISYCDRTVLGGFGVMLDDLLAAVYPVLILGTLALICFLTGHVEWISDAYQWMGAPDLNPPLGSIETPAS